MKKIFSILVFVVIASVAQAQTQQPGAKSKLAQKMQTTQDLDVLFEKAITDFNVPGMAIAIVKDGEVVLSKGYGVRTAGKNKSCR
jgi:CubicO group peptidase (beta-lactamase class C family)